MPLHTITELLGEDGLRARLDMEIARLPEPDRPRIRAAAALAAELHRDDRRSREPYVNHLLRVAIRVVHHYRVRDPEVICAALLHDAVEDHPGALAAPRGGPGSESAPAEQDTAAVREAAFVALAGRFGTRVAGLVAAVTNPEYAPDRDPDEQYREHVVASLAANPWARVIKLSDFTDNAVGIVWSSADKARRVAPKYFPLVDDLRALAARPDTPLDDEVKRHIDDQLLVAARRLAAYVTGGTGPAMS
jgi:(p)ppGpp synthase/HD superfamily hydrolase